MDERDPNFKKLFILQAVCNGATIAGTLLSFLTVNWWVLAAAALIATVVIQYRLYKASTATTTHDFTDERSADFAGFFAGWYDQDGTHDIFCNDLDWLDHNEVRQIVQVLIRRSSRMTIFLRDDTASVCKTLRDAGVQILLRPTGMRLDLKMSLRTDNDDKRLIIRRKTQGSVHVNFIETEDNKLIDFAESIFLLCRRLAETDPIVQAVPLHAGNVPTEGIVKADQGEAGNEPKS